MSASVICCIYLVALLTNVSVDANSVDPHQTAPQLWFEQSDLAQHYLTKRLLKHFSRQQTQTTFFIGALRDNLCAEFLEWTLPVDGLD